MKNKKIRKFFLIISFIILALIVSSIFINFSSALSEVLVGRIYVDPLIFM